MELFNGTIELSLFFDVKSFDLENVPELRELLESILSTQLGNESTGFTTVTLSKSIGSRWSREPVRSLIRLRRRGAAL